MAENQITGTIPEWVQSLAILEPLFLYGKGFSGSIERLVGLTNLRELFQWNHPRVVVRQCRYEPTPTGQKSVHQRHFK